MTFKLFCSGATITGPKHIREGKQNQDALLIRRFLWGTVVVVADGVGSQKFSQYGSQAVVRAVNTVFLLKHIGLVKKDEIKKKIYHYYKRFVKKKYHPEAATTCLFAVLVLGEGIYIGQIGDGLCCGYVNGMKFLLAHSTADFTNCVVPLNFANPNPKWTTLFIPFKKINSIQLMLATDGVSDDLILGKEVEFSQHIIEETMKQTNRKKQQQYLINVLRNWETPLSGDDKTVGLLYFCK